LSVFNQIIWPITTTTYFALDVIGLPEVIASRSVTTTSEGNSYLHLPGVIVAESAGGEVRYLLSDGLCAVQCNFRKTKFSSVSLEKVIAVGSKNPA
jgi:hypothetical protein